MNLPLQPGPPGVFLLAFATVVIIGPSMIEGLRRLKMRQPIGADAPQPKEHQAKHGTPTMGGLLFAFGVLVAITVAFTAGWLTINSQSANLAAVVVVFILHMGLGFLDDYLKATRGKALGLKARQKLIGQLAIALLFVIYLATSPVPGVTTSIAIHHNQLLSLPPLLYYPLVVLLMIGLSNSVNLADGLDGLAAGLAIPVFVGLAIAGVSAQNDAVPLFGWAMAGACLGFIVYNGYPAQVFMGDAGSLAIGGGFAAMAVVNKEEILVLVLCLVYIMETLSVVIQVVSFKSRGKRVFKMAPIHYHFELSGWSEVQIVQRFWIAGVILLWLGLIAAKWLSAYSGSGAT